MERELEINREEMKERDKGYEGERQRKKRMFC